jgi:hypothetical protein
MKTKPEKVAGPVIAALTLLFCGLSAGAEISGEVVLSGGGPAAGARVFLEPGLGGELRMTETGAGGGFRFDGVPPGATGVFASAPGRALSGQHINMPVAGAVDGLRIILPPAGVLRGKVVDPEGNPVPGARITRAALLGENKVGIPFTKLRAYGFEEPATSADGLFTISSLPGGEAAALKIAHPGYAQEAADNLRVGAEEARITLYPGVVAEGGVFSKSGGIPVAGATIIIRNAHPPHETAITQTDMKGNFSIRLKPGQYLYRAAGAAHRSPGWEQLAVTGRERTRMRLAVAGTGIIQGEVRDAVSGDPLADARIAVDTNGIRAAAVRTGPTGEFRVETAEGESIVRLESPPGYLPPADPAIRVQVMQGETFKLPGMWLAPMPEYRLRVIGAEGGAAAGALITLLRPAQSGWRRADEEGRAVLHISRLPEKGRIIGFVEDSEKPHGALFAMSTENREDAVVRLLSFGTVTGTVRSTAGDPLPGVTAASVHEDAEAGAIVLWRCVTDREGRFTWPAALPGVPQQCMVRAGGEGGSMPFNLEPGAVRDLGTIAVAGGERGRTMQGQRPKWHEWPVLAGELPEKDVLKSRPALILHGEADQAEMLTEILARFRELPGFSAIQTAAAVNGTVSVTEPPVPVLKTDVSVPGAVWLINREGVVVLECMGLPPLHVIRKAL